jgi:hypothetical protein
LVFLLLKAIQTHIPNLKNSKTQKKDIIKIWQPVVPENILPGPYFCETGPHFGRLYVHNSELGLRWKNWGSTWHNFTDNFFNPKKA